MNDKLFQPREYVNDVREQYSHMLAERLVSFGFGPGWTHIVRWALAQLDELDGEVQITQVKEKFAGLRIYFDVLDGGDETYEAADEITRIAEARSLQTCEECGELGVVQRGVWLKTLCDEHADDSEPTVSAGSALTLALQGGELSYKQIAAIHKELNRRAERAARAWDRYHELRKESSS